MDLSRINTPDLNISSDNMEPNFDCMDSEIQEPEHQHSTRNVMFKNDLGNSKRGLNPKFPTNTFFINKVLEFKTNKINDKNLEEEGKNETVINKFGGIIYNPRIQEECEHRNEKSKLNKSMDTNTIIEGNNGNRNILSLFKLKHEKEKLKVIPIIHSEERYFARVVSYRFNEIKEIPCFISTFSALQELRLDYNQITILPSEIGAFKLLKTFTISHNLIKSIPDEIQNLKYLTIFILNDNLIEEFNEKLCFIPLQIIYLHNNSIIEIPVKFNNLKHLQEFSFDWFYFTNQKNQRLMKNQDGKLHILKLIKLCKKLENEKVSKCTFLQYLNYIYEQPIEYLSKMKIFPKGRTCLHQSAIQGYTRIIKLFIDNSFDLNIRDDYNSSPLLLSIRANQFVAAALFVKNPFCNPNFFSDRYGVPLHILIHKKQFGLLEDLLNNPNLNPNITDEDENNVFHLLFQHFTINNQIQLEQICLHLISLGCNINTLNSNKLTPINLAIKKNNILAVQFVIKYNNTNPKEKFNFNIKCGKYKWNSLHYSVIYSDIGITYLLLTQEIDITANDTHSRTPRDLALINSTVSKMLIKFEKQFFNRIIRNKSKTKFSQIMHLKNKFVNLKSKIIKPTAMPESIDDACDSFDANEISEGDIDAASRLHEYNTKIPFELDTLAKMNVRSFVSGFTQSKANNENQKNTKNMNKINIQNLNVKVNLNVNIVTNQFQEAKDNKAKSSKPKGKASNENNDFKSTVISSLIDRLQPYRSNDNLEYVEKIIDEENFIKNSLVFYSPTNHSLNRIINKSREGNLTPQRSTDEINEEWRLKRNLFTVEYREIINEKIPLYKRIQMLYYLFNINQKDTTELFTLLLKNTKDNKIKKEILYLSSLKGIVQYPFLNENLDNLVEYEYLNVTESVGNDSFIISKFLSTKFLLNYCNQQNMNLSKTNIEGNKLCSKKNTKSTKVLDQCPNVIFSANSEGDILETLQIKRFRKH